VFQHQPSSVLTIKAEFCFSEVGTAPFVARTDGGCIRMTFSIVRSQQVSEESPRSWIRHSCRSVPSALLRQRCVTHLAPHTAFIFYKWSRNSIFQPSPLHLRNVPYKKTCKVLMKRAIRHVRPKVKETAFFPKGSGSVNLCSMKEVIRTYCETDLLYAYAKNNF